MDLIELRNRVQMIPTLEARRELLLNEVRRAETDVTTLLINYEKESKDVQLIEKETLSSFLFKLLGKYEDKLEKEQMEEVAAKLNYDRAVTRLDCLVSEKNQLNSRIQSLRDEERTYNAELSDRCHDLAKRLETGDGKQYAELENQRNAVISQITEINEALAAASRAEATAQNALKSLDSAEGWATYDTFARGGIISHMMKYSHIDSAEACFHTLSSQLSSLKSELKDVQGLTELGVSEISSTQRAIDFWFDNIFTDLSVLGQIRDNAHGVSRLINDIHKTQDLLLSKLEEQQDNLKENERLEEELLISITQ